MGLTGSDAPQRQSKHTVIMEITDKVFQQIGGLEDLVAEISPRPQKEDEKAEGKQIVPSLSDFLNGEAERLDLAASRIGEAVSELRSLLF